mgnify:CR=1 FL=1
MDQQPRETNTMKPIKTHPKDDIRYRLDGIFPLIDPVFIHEAEETEQGINPEPTCYPYVHLFTIDCGDATETRWCWAESKDDNIMRTEVEQLTLEEIDGLIDWELAYAESLNGMT